MKNFEQPQESVETPEIPAEIIAFWGLVDEMMQKESTPSSYADSLATLVGTLSAKDVEFKKVLSKYKANDVEGMMDALEEYSQIVTEPDQDLQNA